MPLSICIRILRGAGWPARVAGTRICVAGVGTRRAMRACAAHLRGWTSCETGAGSAWYGCDAGAGWEILCARVLRVAPKHINLIRSKIAKHLDVLTSFASIAIRTVRLQQLLHYDVTTHCCETLAQAPAMWWASDHFLALPLYLARNNSV